MISNLNSIILEGVVEGEPFFTENDGPRCEFVVASRHYYQHTSEVEVSRVAVISWGNLATRCAGALKSGRLARVVGRIKQYHDGAERSRIKIVAEHVEYGPPVKDAASRVIDELNDADDDELVRRQ